MIMEHTVKNYGHPALLWLSENQSKLNGRLYADVICTVWNAALAATPAQPIAGMKEPCTSRWNNESGRYEPVDPDDAATWLKPMSAPAAQPIADVSAQTDERAAFDKARATGQFRPVTEQCPIWYATQLRWEGWEMHAAQVAARAAAPVSGQGASIGNWPDFWDAVNCMLIDHLNYDARQIEFKQLVRTVDRYIDSRPRSEDSRAERAATQPAGEVVHSYRMKLADGTYNNWLDCSPEHAAHVMQGEFASGFQVRKLYAAPISEATAPADERKVCGSGFTPPRKHYGPLEYARANADNPPRTVHSSDGEFLGIARKSCEPGKTQAEQADSSSEEINPYVVQTADSSSAAPSEISPVNTIEYWASAYDTGFGGGHGMIVHLLREYATLRKSLAAPSPTGESLSAAIAAMKRAKKLPVWDGMNHELHVELDVIFAALATPRQTEDDGMSAAIDKILTAPIDYSLNKGDIVYNKRWGDGKSSLEIVDINWALRSAAVKLSARGGIVVWPVAGLQREPFAASPAPTGASK